MFFAFISAFMRLSFLSPHTHLLFYCLSALFVLLTLLNEFPSACHCVHVNQHEPILFARIRIKFIAKRLDRNKKIIKFIPNLYSVCLNVELLRMPLSVCICLCVCVLVWIQLLWIYKTSDRPPAHAYTYPHRLSHTFSLFCTHTHTHTHTDVR